MSRFTIPSLVLPLFLSLFVSSCSKEKTTIATAPALPATPYDYSNNGKSKLDVITVNFNLGIVTVKPVTISPPTNMGVTLGHVIFNDNLVLTNACSGCHAAAPGVQSTPTLTPLDNGNSMPNANRMTKTVERRHPGNVFDQPDAIVKRMMATSYYAQLFKDAYGTAEITPERISDALAQYISAMSTASSEQLAYDPRFTNPFK